VNAARFHLAEVRQKFRQQAVRATDERSRPRQELGIGDVRE
jgi:hypothetical protein